MSELRDRSHRGRVTIARHGRLPKRRGWSSALKGLAGALAVVLVSGGTVGAVALHNVTSRVDIVDIPADGAAIPDIGAIKGGFNILIAGTDSRTDQDGLGGDAEDYGGELNDVNILLHVSEDQTRATAISLPRDMIVDIPACTDPDTGYQKYESTEPLNAALGYGGLSCVAQTVEEFTGLPVQFAGLIGFKGVVDMTNAVVGVPVCITGAIDDQDSGLYIPEAGTHTLQGEQALAFLRTRHGVGDGSDLGRINSQQVYLSSLVRTLQSGATLGDPAKVYNLATSALDAMQLSSSLANVPTMMSMAFALKDIPMDRITFVQYPGSTDGTGIYANKVMPDPYLGEQLMDLVRNDQDFSLLQPGGVGSEFAEPEVDPNAPVDPEAPVDPNAPVEAGEEVVDPNAPPELDISGQTAAQEGCAVANNY